ncbi:hypothetical protein NE237_022726 [Protea cynaroides]|uniref:Uncharacterized protein n=1 Tax=Protea cynaroides TaxID=273540 RepID=A0A9Q0HEZ7_9MAGN|nr:hypothetical protein NE237_022726 [Protea cynaroides]
MAKVKFIFVSVLLLVSAFSHAVNSVEGRHLRFGKQRCLSNKIPITPIEKTETASTKAGENISQFPKPSFPESILRLNVLVMNKGCCELKLLSYVCHLFTCMVTEQRTGVFTNLPLMQFQPSPPI